MLFSPLLSFKIRHICSLPKSCFSSHISDIFFKRMRFIGLSKIQTNILDFIEETTTLRSPWFFSEKYSDQGLSPLIHGLSRFGINHWLKLNHFAGPTTVEKAQFLTPPFSICDVWHIVSRFKTKNILHLYKSTHFSISLQPWLTHK